MWAVKGWAAGLRWWDSAVGSCRAASWGCNGTAVLLGPFQFWVQGGHLDQHVGLSWSVGHLSRENWWKLAIVGWLDVPANCRQLSGTAATVHVSTGALAACRFLDSIGSTWVCLAGHVGQFDFFLGVKHKVPLVRFESQISRENLRLKSGSWVDISCLSRPPNIWVIVHRSRWPSFLPPCFIPPSGPIHPHIYVFHCFFSLASGLHSRCK